jgi:flagella basal body P-ring formation protein FlgA
MVWAGLAQAADPGAVKFRAEAEVAGEHITLGHLADLPPELAGSVGQAPIWSAPPPGQSYTLTGEFLRYRLTQMGLAELAAAGLPPAITVRQTGRVLPPEEVAKAIQRYLREHSPYPEKNLRLTVYPLEEAVLLPEGPYSLEVVPPKQGRLLGELTLELALVQEGRPLKRFKAAGRVSLEMEVVCATRPLMPPQVLSAGDVSLLRREVTTLTPQDLFTHPEQVVGRTLARPLGPREIVTPRHLSQQPLIQKGEEVTVLLMDGGLEIRTKGVAQEPGFPGKAIRLLNPKSKKEFQAQVVDHKTVRVIL